MRKFLGELVLLSVRGVLLWLVVPAAVAAWVVGLPVRRARHQRVGLGQTIGWADLNLIALLQRAFRAEVGRERQPLIPWRDVANVTHRVRLTDLW